jgi:hypothetical protein
MLEVFYGLKTQELPYLQFKRLRIVLNGISLCVKSLDYSLADFFRSVSVL